MPQAVPFQIRFHEQYIPEPNSGCWLWVGAIFRDTGYGALSIKNKAKTAHRLSWEIHKGTVPDGLCVLHRCDVRSCVNPEHLFLGTFRDNSKDCSRKGRHGQQKIFYRDLDEIMRLRLSGLSQRAIARKYQVKQSTMWELLNGKGLAATHPIKALAGISWHPIALKQSARRLAGQS